MKHKIVFCLLIFAFFFQNSTLRAQGWDKTYTSPLGDTTVAHSVVEAHDGGLVFSGATYMKSPICLECYNYSPFVTKTDKLGNIIWRYNPANLKLFIDTTQIIRLRDSSFLFFGTELYRNNTGVDTLEKISLMSIKLDKNGNELWHKRFASTTAYAFTNAALSLDSSQVFISALSRGYDSLNGYNNVAGTRLIRMSVTGDSLWSKFYLRRFLYELAVGGDGYLYSSVNDQITYKNYDKYIIWKLNENGDTVWTKLNYFGKLKKANDGRILLNGVRKFDYDGHLIFGKINTTYDYNFEGSYSFTSGLKDNNIRLISSNNPYLPVSYNYVTIYLANFDSIGHPINQRIFEATNANQFTDLIPTSDGGFIGVGFTDDVLPFFYNGHRRARLVKFTADGLVFSNLIKGKIHIDSIQNCHLDASEKGFSNRLLSIEKITKLDGQ